tara:strand:- start:7025 stop:7240 length:216 start_codon:yes stop_codon:yes gene_type:complete
LPVIKKPLGTIRITARTRTPKGKIFSPGEEYQYYSIIERRECSCGEKKGKLMYRLYKTSYGLVPVTKAIII